MRSQRSSEQAVIHVFGHLAPPNRGAWHYLTVSAPTLQTSASWSPVPPLQPTAPMIFPSSMRGEAARRGRQLRIQRAAIGMPGLVGVVEDPAFAPPTCGRACLVLRDGDGGQLSSVHPDEIQEFAVRVDDGDVHLPIALLRLRFRGRENLLATLQRDRRAIRDIEGHLVGRAFRRRRGGLCRGGRSSCLWRRGLLRMRLAGAQGGSHRHSGTRTSTHENLPDGRGFMMGELPGTNSVWQPRRRGWANKPRRGPPTAARADVTAPPPAAAPLPRSGGARI